jgi:hypothetical protein
LETGKNKESDKRKEFARERLLMEALALGV